ncbi:MAG: 6-carboxytetrahydropterin synthase [Planctomycetota bacterium]|nr:6-carboxytetrahydropterin synthase [Planctomycetota bacterium]
MERWAIEIEKEYFKFSAAHFLIFPDGSAERLHGHNYRVFVEIDGSLSDCGLVIDFKAIKPVVRELLDGLDEHFLIPSEHPHLTWEETADGNVEVRYLDRRYSVPAEDVIALPLNNTSSENLAGFVGRELRGRLAERFGEVRVRGLRVAVEETAGQRGVYHYAADEQPP